MAGQIYFCHAVDAEGPLYEGLNATFDRINDRFGLQLEATSKNISALREKKINLNGKEAAVADFVREDRVNRYLGSWDQIDRVNETIMSSDWRRALSDKNGEPYVLSWFCMDHVGYKLNPRRRAMGYHEIYDYYKEALRSYELPRDRIYWHFHPPSISGDAHRMGYGFAQGNIQDQILARRIIDRSWFPVAQRPGGHIETYDINVWLEAWLPFDLANLAKSYDVGVDLYAEGGGLVGRHWDWRGAPTDWRVYNPDLYDFRKEGGLKRWLSRCLNLNARHSNIDEEEIKSAFEMASRGKDVLVSYSNHDFRDMINETEWLVEKIRKVAFEYKSVGWRWANAVEAFRDTLHLPIQDPPNPQIGLTDKELHIKVNKPIWGNQPFLALRTKSGEYYRENMIMNSPLSWSYGFDADSIDMNALSHVALAFNDKTGNTTVCVKDLISRGNFVITNHNVGDTTKK